MIFTVTVTTQGGAPSIERAAEELQEVFEPAIEALPWVLRAKVEPSYSEPQPWVLRASEWEFE